MIEPAAAALVSWRGAAGERSARWRSHSGTPAPRRAVAADDTLPADKAYRLACEGTALVWQGDFHNARQLLQALARRIDRRPHKGRQADAPAESTAQAFHRHRQAQGHRARILAMLVLPVEPGHVIELRRAPDVREACEAAYGPADEPYLVSLRELQGLIGAHEWRRKGVAVKALGDVIHPHYGVFSPVRGEYIDLVARTPLPGALAQHPTAFDIGTGTGVLAALLARRGVAQVVATDIDPRALDCARSNLQRLGLAPRVQLLQADLFPPGQAGLLVCNPPWVPARPTSTVEQAVYDPDSRMLRAFLAGAREHLAPAGEAWLILSDLAEHLGLRTRAELEAWIADGGLQVVGRLDIRPRHGKAFDPDDPLHLARSAEVTSLWRLAAR